MIVVVDGNGRIRKESFDPHANAMFCFCDNIYLKDYNNMGGTIIHELSHLSALRRLSFVGNAQLHGTLPESWGGLSQLRTLDLFDELQLNGTIPESYAKLTKIGISVNIRIGDHRSSASWNLLFTKTGAFVIII